MAMAQSDIPSMFYASKLPKINDVLPLGDQDSTATKLQGRDTITLSVFTTQIQTNVEKTQTFIVPRPCA